MKVINFLVLLCMLTLVGVSQPVFAKKHKTHKTTHKTVQKTHKKIAHKAAATTAAAASYQLPMAVSGSQLGSQIERIIYDSPNADIAVYVKSMKNGDALYRRNINQALTPASTMKIFTAEAALLFLGPDYRFSTQLLTDAKSIKNGILQGNLYVVLSGDPTLTYYDLVDLMLTLKSQQIQAISGNVYIDNTAYDQHFYGPGWEEKDKEYCYAAPISASIINHNCVSFKVTPSKIAGHNAQIVTSPKYFYMPFQNSVVTRATRTRGCGVRMSKVPGSGVALDGCMAQGRYAVGISYVVTELNAYNYALFKNLLNRIGVSVYGRTSFANAPHNLSLIGQHASKPLRLLINDMLKKSDNIIAGALFKKIGQLYSKSPGSWENGRTAVAQILAKNAGLDTSGVRLLDGSGLSPDNLTTPAQMMQVLDFAYHHYPTSYEFISALPIAGVDGTLKHRMGNIARKIRAKTGTISGVISLAGYAVSADKEPLAFVIMINGSKGMGWRYRSIEDKIATVLTRYRR